LSFWEASRKNGARKISLGKVVHCTNRIARGIKKSTSLRDCFDRNPGLVFKPVPRMCLDLLHLLCLFYEFPLEIRIENPFVILNLLAPHDSLLPGVHSGLSAIDQVQFPQDIADMAFDSTKTDDQFFSDFLVRVASGNQCQHFHLPLG